MCGCQVLTLKNYALWIALNLRWKWILMRGKLQHNLLIMILSRQSFLLDFHLLLMSSIPSQFLMVKCLQQSPRFPCHL